MKRDDDGMTMLRALAVLALVASCGDPGSYVLGTLPVAGGGVGQSGAITGYDGGTGGAGGGSNVTGGGSSVTGGGSDVTGGGSDVTGGGSSVTGGGSNVTGGGSASAPCNCEVADLTLTVSWECCVAHFFFDRQVTCSNYVDSSMACGLTVVELFGPQTTIVRDGFGAAIGGQRVSDTSDYVCPDDASLHALIVRGGVFPDAGCSESACSCVDDAIACP